MEYRITIVPTSGYPSQRIVGTTFVVIVPCGWSPIIIPKIVKHTGHLIHYLSPISPRRHPIWIIWLHFSCKISSSSEFQSSFSQSRSENSNWQIQHLSWSGFTPCSSNSNVGQQEYQTIFINFLSLVFYFYLSPSISLSILLNRLWVLSMVYLLCRVTYFFPSITSTLNSIDGALTSYQIYIRFPLPLLLFTDVFFYSFFPFSSFFVSAFSFLATDFLVFM